MKDEEARLQEGCVRWFSYQYPELSMLLHHSPNGGWRNATEGAKFKRMGTRAGFPDLILLVASGDYHYLAIEMKTEKSGSRQSETQKNYQKAIESHGGKYVVCRTFVQFMATISEYLKNTYSTI